MYRRIKQQKQFEESVYFKVAAISPCILSLFFLTLAISFGKGIKIGKSFIKKIKT